MKTQLTALLTTGLLVLAACGQASTEEPAAKTTEPAANTEAEAPSSTPIPDGKLSVSNSLATQEMALGNPDAKLTVIEYASVTCPGCAYFHEEVYPQLKTDYIETGKINFIFREFPTAPQQLSYLGFILSRCAADDKGSEAYFAMINTLFKNQRTWVSQTASEELLKYAGQAGLTKEAFEACIAREDIIEAINDNITTGRTEDNVDSTPTFVLNGEKMGRYNTAEEFFALLDEAIAKAEAQ
jgi:protein-disulfide isomerase